jgi:hypothetical protein
MKLNSHPTLIHLAFRANYTSSTIPPPTAAPVKGQNLFSFPHIELECYFLSFL